MTSLAERCEAATGPDRQLDVEILTKLLGYRDIFGDQVLFDRANEAYWSLDGNEKNPALPSPTGSIDDAYALLPETAGFTLQQLGYPCLAMAIVPGNAEQGGQGHTPALALCAAAIRARGE